MVLVEASGKRLPQSDGCPSRTATYLLDRGNICQLALLELRCALLSHAQMKRVEVLALLEVRQACNHVLHIAHGVLIPRALEGSV